MSCNYCGSQLDNVVHLHRDQNDLFEEDSYDSVLTPPYLDESEKQGGEDQEYERQDVKKSTTGNGLLSLFLVGLSIQLTTIALMLLFFSENGSLVLSFNSAYWPVYLFIALPLLYWGIQSLDDVNKDFSNESE